DPMLVASGATVGGLIASNTSGSGRYRYGGVRDFILGVRFVDGEGNLVSSGGKVVKNSAGFDLPKFFVGSMGRYGVITEASFKVFPQPPVYKTLRITFETLSVAIDAIFKLATSPLEMHALDIEPDGDTWAMLIRIGGLADALPGRLERLATFLNTESIVIEDDAERWRGVSNLAWAGELPVVKVPVSPRQIPVLDAKAGHARRYTAGGNVAWIATEDIDTLRAILTELNLVGLQLTGTTDNPYIGQRKGVALAQRVKRALDPNNTFLED
ncbi:MAG: FAD-binding oxidoreductase, partial [Chloroflexota bacterium]